jgi:hypothetical protein
VTELVAKRSTLRELCLESAPIVTQVEPFAEYMPDRIAGARLSADPGQPHSKKEPPVRIRNPLASLFARSRAEDFLASYVIREYRAGRNLADVLKDPYVRNRSSPQERARLFERPDVVQAIGAETAAEFARLRAASPS